MKCLLLLLLSALLLAGCGQQNVPPPDEPGIPDETVTAPTDEMDKSSEPNVAVHWDAWTPDDTETPKTIANRWYDSYTDDLIPSPDYGQLIPYIGAENANPFWGSGYMLGLATMDGTIVTDPVFLHAGYNDYSDSSDGSSGYLPVFMLSKGTELADGTSRFCYGLAADDGSWYTGMIYRNYITTTPYGTLMVEIGGDVVLVGSEGEEVFRWQKDHYPIPEFNPALSWYWDTVRLRGKYLLYVTDWTTSEPDYDYVDLTTGHVTSDPPADLPPELHWDTKTLPYDGGYYEWDDNSIYIYPDSGGEYSFPLEGYHIDGIYDGKVMLSTSGSISEIRYMVKDLSGNILFGPYVGHWLYTLPQYISGPLMLCWADYQGPGEILDLQGNVVARPLGSTVYQYGQRLSFMDETAYRITDLEGNDLLCIPRFVGDD